MSDYEKLKKEGYTEEQINVMLQDVNKVKLGSSPMGLNRDDRSVHIENANGINMRTSNVMMGYNNKNLSLANGDYVNEDEIARSLQKELSSSSENKVVICKKTGKKCDVSELINKIIDISKKESTLSIGSSNPKINNQKTSEIGIKPKNYHDVIKKGYLMLGNKGVQLSSGEYIQMSEITKALEDYVYLISPEKDPASSTITSSETTPISQTELHSITSLQPSIPSNIIPNKTVEKHRVVKRRKNNSKVWPIILAALLTAMLGFKYNQKSVTIHEIEDISNLNYTAYGISEEMILENEDEILQRVMSDIKTGDTTEMEAGVKYYKSSDYQYGGDSTHGTFGSTIRPEGTYTIDYISIINNGKIDHVVYEQGKNLGNVIEEYCKNNNTDISKLDIKIHIGGPVSGWVDLKDVLNKDDLKPQIKETKSVLDKQYSGEINNFSGQFLTINVNGKSVSLNIMDQNGNLLKEGSVVVGSDGQEYKLTKLNISDFKKLNSYKKYLGKELNWSVQNINQELALLLAASGIVGTYLVNIKKKEDYSKLDEETLRAFLDAKERYKKQSIFKKIEIALDGKRPDWNKIQNMLEVGKMSIEDIGNMYR